MKKICFVTTIPGTLRSFVLELSKYLHANGDFDITFICDEDETFAASLPEYIHFIPVPMKRGISLGAVKAMLRLRKIFKREKFDLVQYSTPNASLYASIAAKAAKIPVRLYCQWGLVYVGFEGWKRKLFKLEEKLVCKLSTFIEPDSYGNLKFCRSEGLYPEEKSSVVHHGSASGVSLEKYEIEKSERFRSEIRKKWNVPENAYVYGFVGRINRDKGINELLTAAKELTATQEDSCFMLIGAEEKTETLHAELLAWAKHEPRVIFCGTTNEVPKFMAAMDCYVMPSYREGFGLTVVEAGAMGLPVICTDIPGPTDAIHDGENGLIVEKKDANALARAMQTLYDDRALGKKLGENGRKNVEENYDQQTLFRYILEDRNRLLGVETKQ